MSEQPVLTLSPESPESELKRLRARIAEKEAFIEQQNERIHELAVRSRMITWYFFKKMGFLCVPFLEHVERCFVEQAFLRDVVIIQVDEAFKGCLEGGG